MIIELLKIDYLKLNRWTWIFYFVNILIKVLAIISSVKEIILSIWSFFNTNIHEGFGEIFRSTNETGWLVDGLLVRHSSVFYFLDFSSSLCIKIYLYINKPKDILLLNYNRILYCFAYFRLLSDCQIVHSATDATGSHTIAHRRYKIFHLLPRLEKRSNNWWWIAQNYWFSLYATKQWPTDRHYQLISLRYEEIP